MVANCNSKHSSNHIFFRLIIGFLALIVSSIALASDDELWQRKTQMQSCRSVSEIICETTAFSSFYEILEETGLESLLDAPDGVLTVFVPTNRALEEFGIHERLVASSTNNYNNETEFAEDDLIDLLFFHAIPDRLVKGTDLNQCGESFVMINGEETTVVCGENGGRSVFLSGSGNDMGMLPQVVITDVVACNGLIHVINGVLKDDLLSPSEAAVEYSGGEHDRKPETDSKHPEEDCQSIQEVICGMEKLTAMCAHLDDGGILKPTTTANGLWTVFAPTDEGFDEIQDVLRGMRKDEIINILKFHTVPGEEVFSDDLVCESDLTMGNTRSSRTVCSSYNDVFQEGPGNALRNHPRIIGADMTACNGVVHIVDQVMLPDLEMTAMVGRTGVSEGEEATDTIPSATHSNQSRQNPGLVGRLVGRPGRLGNPWRNNRIHATP
mmetsp:Transcript_7304/g.15113  ORF Transcript_7304/g.15113 Transcript_7304/m.15113 type:complete len:439 (-) Transcript_7304:48-1364(-)